MTLLVIVIIKYETSSVFKDYILWLVPIQKYYFRYLAGFPE
jgi:hypothetical protein